MIAAYVPSAPLSLQKLSSSKSSVSLQWQAPTTDGGAYITSYNVYSNSGAGIDFTFVAATSGLSYTHSNLSPSGITITYKVAAVNHVGEGSQTSEVSVIVATVPG